MRHTTGELALETAEPRVGWGRVFDLRPPLWAMVLVGAAMSLAFPAYMLLAPRERIVVYVSDDAYYYFNVAAHIAAGDGPTADGITTTTGFHPLYGFLLAGIHWLTNPSLDGFVDQGIALNAVLHLLAAGLLYLAAARWWGPTAGVAAALLWLTNPHATKVRAAGLEGALYAATLSLLLWQLAVYVRRTGAPGGAATVRERSTPEQPSGSAAGREGETWRGAGEKDIAALSSPLPISPSPPLSATGPAAPRHMAAGRYLRTCAVLGICGGLVVLTRTDALLLVAGVAVLLLGTATAIRWPVRAGGVCLLGAMVAAFFAPWLVYVWHHTGEWVQGSAAVKTAWRQGMTSELSTWAAAGMAFMMWWEFVLKGFVKVPALKWVLSGIPLLVWRGETNRGHWWLLHGLWLIPIGLGLAYGLLLDRVRTWYYVPALVMLTLLSAGAAARLYHAEGKLHWLQSLVKRCLPLIAWAVVIESAAIFGRDVLHGRSSEQLFAVEAAGMLVEQVEPGTRLGCWHSGIVQYYTPGLDIINLDGLANNDILGILRGEKTMNEYWDEREITIILGQPREKMGGFKTRWGNKKLVSWQPLIQRVVVDDEERKN